MAAVDVERTAEEILARVQVPRAVEELCSHGVRIEWKPGPVWADPDDPVGVVTWYLDSVEFIVELDQSVDVLRLLRALKTASEFVAEPRVWPMWNSEPAGFLSQPTARYSISGSRCTP